MQNPRELQHLLQALFAAYDTDRRRVSPAVPAPRGELPYAVYVNLERLIRAAGGMDALKAQTALLHSEDPPEEHCLHCGQVPEEHPEGYCLFSPVRFTACDARLPACVMVPLRTGHIFDAVQEIRATQGITLKDARDILVAERQRHKFPGYARGGVPYVP